MNRLDNFFASVTDIHAPKPSQTIEQAAARGIREETALARSNNLRSLLMHFLMIRERMQMKRAIRLLQLSQCLLGHGMQWNTGFTVCQTHTYPLTLNPPKRTVLRS